jgi:hypothetical protein
VSRILASVAAIVIAINLVGCAQVIAEKTATSATACVADAKSSPAGVVVFKHLWAADGTDNAEN